MSIKTTYPFDNQNNYFFDDTKIEITGGVAKLIAQYVPGTAYLYAKLDENQGLVARDTSGNQRDGAFQGGYTENIWTTGKINSAIEGIGTSGGFVNFDQFGVFERTDSFSAEFWVKFTSSATQTMFSKQESAGNFEGYGVNVLSGKVRTVIRDDVGNVMSKEHNIAINDGSFHHVVMTYDGSSDISGLVLYIDNTVNSAIIASDTLTGSIHCTADLQLSGRDGNNVTIDVGTVIDEFVIYDRELSSAEVAFRWNGGAGTQDLPGGSTSFPINDPPIKPRTSISMSAFLDFDDDITEVGSDEIRYITEVAGQGKYWNGSTWINSDGTFSQSNTGAEVKANVSSLVFDTGSPIRIIVLLHSDDGSTTPEISEFDVTYDVSGQPDEIYKCIVYGTNLKSDGTPDDSEFIIQISEDAKQYKTETVIRDDRFVVTPDVNGYWEQELVETVNMPESVFYEFRFKENVIIRKDVPEEIRKNIWDLPDP